MTDAGLKHLAGMTRLQTLYLHHTAVTDAGLDLLKEFKDLRYLYRQGNEDDRRGSGPPQGSDPGPVHHRRRVKTPMLHQIEAAQTTEERFLRHIFVRDQMAEWSEAPARHGQADGVHYWDVHGKRYLDALSGIYVVSVGHNNRRVIEAIQQAARHAALLPADARHQPRRRAAGQPARRAGPRRPRRGQVPVRRLAR